MELLPILIVAIIIIVAVVLITSKKPAEQYPASYAYQYNYQPFYLSSQAQQNWMKPAIEICKPRAASECGGVPFDQRIGCIQHALQSCLQSNSKRISQDCSADLPKTMCKHHCTNPESCSLCMQYVKAFGVCSKPDLMG